MIQRLSILAGVLLTTVLLAGADAKSETRFELLTRLVGDESPKVRLEALRALAKIPSARSAELALSVLDKPMDPTLDYALWLTINDLAEQWITAIQSGEWKPEGREKQLEFGLKAIKSEQASRVLGKLLETHPLTNDGQGPWIELIGRAGSPKELQQLFDQVLRRGFNIPTAARAIAALNEASRLRNARPTSGLDRIDILLDGPGRISSEAVRLAGAWKMTGSLPKLVSIAEDKRTPPPIRQIVFETLRQIGEKRAVEALTSLAAPGKDAAIRRQAVGALAAIDLGQAIPLAVEIGSATTNEASALELWRSVLGVKGAGQSLRDSLSEKVLPEVAAKAGMRVAREGGRNDVDLVVAFAMAGGIASDTQALSDELIKELASKAIAQGDPFRGEMVYRRADLACITCHAIGGAGGKVGPDMTSIGASAPVDYLVESLALPGTKIKEGYHAINIETKDGQSLSGTLARETQDEIVLRNSVGAEVRITKNDIESRQNSTLSLMPGGLLDNLAEQEKLDLIAFLSRLGKPGEFDASKGGVARKWRTYTFTHTDQQHGKNNDVWEKPFDDKMWQPVYSLVNGKLSRQALEEAGKRQFWAGTLAVYAATEIQIAKAGSVKLKLDAAGAPELWIDGRKIGGVGETPVELSAGTHRLLVRLDPKNVPEFVRLESSDGTFLTN
jgi:putative heme-binding domain-containing protein